MPTPFTHLETAQRLLRDPQVPAAARALLEAERSAFLLGQIAADARVNSGLLRTDTHFYHYDQPIIQHPWRVMLERHPALLQAETAAQRAFLAGYVAHLCVDEVWLMEMLKPHFGDRDWAPQPTRFFILHILLIFMDERDYTALEDWQQQCLFAAQPEGWAPFMGDDTLREWRNLIAAQLPPEGESQTLQILGPRVGRKPSEFRAILDAPKTMQSRLWDHISPEILAQVETQMYTFAREQMIIYLSEAGAL